MNDISELLKKDTILDACSLISLYATGQFIPILKCISGQVYLASYVERLEIKKLYNPLTDSSDIPIDLSDAKNSGLLVITQPTTETETLEAVNFATAMSTTKPGKNSGEAITGAIAKSRGWTMSTDDLFATDFLTSQGIGSSLTTTLHIIQFWANTSGISKSDTKAALEFIRLHARYSPSPKSHPLFSWWKSFSI